MIDLIPHLRRHLEPLQERLDCFCRYGVQLEGWFKGELLFALDKIRCEGVVREFDREVLVAGKRVDFRIDVGAEHHWVEVKFWLVGRQRGTNYRPNFYFGDPTSVGISLDVNALVRLPEPGRRWMLILTAARPTDVEWQEGVLKFNRKFGHHLASVTSPHEFPPAYFLGLLDVDGEEPQSLSVSIQAAEP